MKHTRRLRPLAAGLLAVLAVATFGTGMAGDPPQWRVVIANDTCPDVTWGFTYDQTRQALADLIGAHLDEMNRTDAGAPEDRDHYNATAFIEVEAFLEKYPHRKDEFLRRVREGRLGVSPFLCNSLWGFQSVEGALRTFYPARRMEREGPIPLDIAEHIELPSLPWGMVSLMAGCGIRWTSVPFLDYDTTFKGLKNPPLFRHQGPDGSEIRVVLDAWASLKANYAQGGHLLRDPSRVTSEWIPHYAELGAAYPLRTVFASGTHSDINPGSGKQARGFADGIAQYNAGGNSPVKLVNGTLRQFCQEVDAAEKQAPFLPMLRGCFGHSWELWPVSLAQTAAALREQERAFLAAESLVALASQAEPGLAGRTRADREQAEWFWAMLADHAWNGTDLPNKRHNAELRRRWAAGLGRISRSLTREAWLALGLKPEAHTVTVFNPLSFPNDILVTCETPDDATQVLKDGQPMGSHVVTEDSRRRITFVAGAVPAFGFREFRLAKGLPRTAVPPFSATSNSLEGPFYRLTVDLQNGGLSSLIHRSSRQELVVASQNRSLCQTVFHDGQEHLLSDVECQLRFDGLRGELRVSGHFGTIRVTNVMTLYAGMDRVDFDVQIEKPATTNEQRLLHFFPVGDGTRDLRIETTAAVLRPRLQPDGDLLPGADPRRFAVQGFADCSPAGRVGVTIVPLDAFMLRLDQGALAFEALGNDQNWKEVSQDQDGVPRFRFRYCLRAHPPGYDNAATFAWSRSVSAPVTVAAGRLPKRWLDRPHLEIDPTRALATCFKPAEGDTPSVSVVRVWETAGAGGPLALWLPGCRQATETDLLERDRGELPVKHDRVSVSVRGHGFAAVKLRR